MNNVSQEEIKEPSELYNVTILVLWNKICENMKKIKKIEDARIKKEADEDKKQKEKDNKKENKSIDPLVILLKEQLKDKVKDVRISSRLTDSAVCLVGDDNAMDPHLEKILQQHNQLNQELSLKILEINSDHKLIKKMAKMCTKKEEIGEISKIATMLYEQSKILDGEKPSDPAGFSRDLIDIIYSSVK